jgi:hypothetical protein
VLVGSCAAAGGTREYYSSDLLNIAQFLLCLLDLVCSLHD